MLLKRGIHDFSICIKVWRSSFQTVTGGATISFQLDKFTRLIVCSSFYCILPKEIHRYYYNR